MGFVVDGDRFDYEEGLGSLEVFVGSGVEHCSTDCNLHVKRDEGRDSGLCRSGGGN